mmetsp:Transcript_7839/g.14775  ORF Transcript_7839/g.14775 Transcript_7839/m.14775 type:complete len:482 (-) Transcript_7839:84-1529(-)
MKSQFSQITLDTLLLGWFLVVLGREPFFVFSFAPSSPQHHHASYQKGDSSLIRPIGKDSNHMRLFMADPKQDLTGKVVAQRYIYRFAPTKSTVTSRFTLEERQYYTVAQDRSLEAFGDKCFIFRDAEASDDGVDPPEESLKKNGMPRVYTRLGKVLYKVNDLKEGDEEEEGVGGSVWESSYAMALYCMENPDVFTGKGIEVGSGVGVGGILSAIGAGLASSKSDASSSSNGPLKYQSIEDIANTPLENNNNDDYQEENKKSTAPVPIDLTKIIMTDSHEPLLNTCLDNLAAASFPVSKAEVALLDWNRRLPNDMKNNFDFIIGCDCAYYFPLVNPLARTVAYGLKSSPYDRKNNEQIVRGKFLHIGPRHRESIDDLRRKLARGYRMNTRMKDIVLERIDLVPLIIDSMENVDAQMKEEVEGETGGYVEYQNMETTNYSVLVGYHNEDYDGFNGDYFFPAETGKEGSYGDSAQELDYGTETM